MEKIILLGASGSIGTQTIDIISQYKDKFELCGFSVGNKISYVHEYIKLFQSVSFVVVKRKEDMEELKAQYPTISFAYGDEGLLKMIEEVPCTMVVNALVGFVGFLPTLKAIEKKRDVALANKESLVVGGNLVNKLLKENGVKLYPIDSEHVALSKCLKGQKKVKKLILTASGGSFRDFSRDQLENVTVEDALKHPSWNMGKKITIDCATMMNKGFEIIEAYHLFNCPLDKIDILIHDESKIHSLVEFEDGSYIADIGPSDMRIPISYALFRARRMYCKSDALNLEDFKTFHFRQFDKMRYPCVEYARQALKINGTMPAVLNAANEEAVNAFLNKKIKFLTIEKIIKNVMSKHISILNPSKEDLIYVDSWARREAQALVKEEETCI